MEGAVAVEIDCSHSSVKAKVQNEGQLVCALYRLDRHFPLPYLSIDFPLEKVEARVDAQDSS